ncbi:MULTISPECIES: GlxA family transcriptional regulator [Glaesserella]|uniref:AraC family transcriptional regulator n=1 Tax=Glaesserella australis TaxID=2094024 RepID=A0A328C2C6_9PAST|nr:MULTISPECIES: helix-turn-helix domain-containing protein [Glaesserella]AUI66866.1 AraC family transcriptional regulator [Glaesserella sp. 15-184]RAL19917.1 AraC family transcriptional regulator [Glaesserella australis]
MPIPTVVLVLYPNFSPFHFSVPYMVFSTELDGKPLFRVKIVAETPETTQSKPATITADGDLSLLNDADFVVMFGWDKLEQMPSAALIQALQQAAERGATLVGLCYGAYPLAYAGLLNGKKATTHWLGETDFRQRFPQVKLDCNAIYIEQEQVITSAGTAAGLDCCLAIVRRQYGVKIANQLARLLVISPHREGGQAQFIEQPIARKTANENINELLEMMRTELNKDYSIDLLAQRLMMSRSTFTRHFRKATGMALTEWLIEVRLQRGRELLESTKQNVDDIAHQIGFHSATAFRQHFKAKHQISPRVWRKRFGGSNSRRSLGKNLQISE